MKFDMKNLPLVMKFHKFHSINNVFTKSEETEPNENETYQSVMKSV